MISYLPLTACIIRQRRLQVDVQLRLKLAGTGEQRLVVKGIKRRLDFVGVERARLLAARAQASTAV